jgi:uncharacterized integral membrane protein
MSIGHRHRVERGFDPGQAILIRSPVPPDQAAQVVTRSAQPARRSRLGPVWGAMSAAAAIAVLLIFLMLQGTARIQVASLGFSGTASMSVALLIALVGGIVTTMVVVTARIAQLRHRAGVGLRQPARTDSGRSWSHG